MKAQTSGGIGIIWGATHRDGKGNLISRQASIEPPEMPEKLAEPDSSCRECINQYIRDFDKWTKECKELMKEYQVILDYHEHRVEFAEKHRNNTIPDKYRTGEDSPTTKMDAEREIKVLRKLDKNFKSNKIRRIKV